MLKVHHYQVKKRPGLQETNMSFSSNQPPEADVGGKKHSHFSLFKTTMNQASLFSPFKILLPRGFDISQY